MVTVSLALVRAAGGAPAPGPAGAVVGAAGSGPEALGMVGVPRRGLGAGFIVRRLRVGR